MSFFTTHSKVNLVKPLAPGLQITRLLKDLGEDECKKCLINVINDLNHQQLISLFFGGIKQQSCNSDIFKQIRSLVLKSHATWKKKEEMRLVNVNSSFKPLRLVELSSNELRVIFNFLSLNELVKLYHLSRDFVDIIFALCKVKWLNAVYRQEHWWCLFHVGDYFKYVKEIRLNDSVFNMPAKKLEIGFKGQELKVLECPETRLFHFVRKILDSVSKVNSLVVYKNSNEVDSDDIGWLRINYNNKVKLLETNVLSLWVSCVHLNHSLVAASLSPRDMPLFSSLPIDYEGGGATFMGKHLTFQIYQCFTNVYRKLVTETLKKCRYLESLTFNVVGFFTFFDNVKQTLVDLLQTLVDIKLKSLTLLFNALNDLQSWYDMFLLPYCHLQKLLNCMHSNMVITLNYVVKDSKMFTVKTHDLKIDKVLRAGEIGLSISKETCFIKIQYSSWCLFHQPLSVHCFFDNTPKERDWYFQLFSMCDCIKTTFQIHDYDFILDYYLMRDATFQGFILKLDEKKNDLKNNTKEGWLKLVKANENVGGCCLSKNQCIVYNEKNFGVYPKIFVYNVTVD